MELDPRLRRSVLELRRAARLRARVEVVDRAAGREAQRVVVVRRLGAWPVVGRLEDRLALGLQLRVVELLEAAAGLEVVAVVLGVRGLRVEYRVRVEPRRA